MRNRAIETLDRPESGHALVLHDHIKRMHFTPVVQSSDISVPSHFEPYTVYCTFAAHVGSQMAGFNVPGLQLLSIAISNELFGSETKGVGSAAGDVWAAELGRVAGHESGCFRVTTAWSMNGLRAAI